MGKELSAEDKMFAKEPTITANQSIEELIVGGGCFWCIDSVYRHMTGVK